ncbi:MAG: malonyl-ACP O-methyltransferase BioC [Methylomonas sp.]|jgi:malonyl-CoA O-methyltransferase
MESRLEKKDIKRSFAAAAGRYDSLAALQRQAGMALLEKFPLQPDPGLILDLGCGTGFLTRQMAVDPGLQSILALDIALPMLLACREKNCLSPIRYICADAEKIPLADACVRQIYANLALQWCQDLAAVFTDCRRILKKGGQLAFTTFGPATLRELKAAWGMVDDYTHVNRFYDERAIYRRLKQAGFVAIRCESQVIQNEYSSVLSLMRELKGLGAHNVATGRNRAPTTRRKLQRMIDCYENNMLQGRIEATYEIIFVRAVAEQ